MKKLISLIISMTLIIPVQASAATSKPTPKPKTTKAKVVKKPGVKKPVVKKPGVKKPGVKKPVVKKPGVKKPGVKKPGVKKPGVKKPVVKKPVFRKKKNLPAKKQLKWPPAGFENKGNLYAKTATKKELGITGTENKYIQKNLINYCHEVACLGIFVGSETGCDWWEITSNVLGIDPENSISRIIYGSLTTLAPGSKGKKVIPILLISDEPIADGLGIATYTANCRIGTPSEKVPSNIYTKSPARS